MVAIMVNRLLRRLQRHHLAPDRRADGLVLHLHLVRAVPAPDQHPAAGALVAGPAGRARQRAGPRVRGFCLLLVLLAQRDAGGSRHVQLGARDICGRASVQCAGVLGAGEEGVCRARHAGGREAGGHVRTR